MKNKNKIRFQKEKNTNKNKQNKQQKHTKTKWQIINLLWQAPAREHNEYAQQAAHEEGNAPPILMGQKNEKDGANTDVSVNKHICPQAGMHVTKTPLNRGTPFLFPLMRKWLPT